MSGMNQHVIPTGDRWAVRRAGSRRSSRVFDTQREAITAATGIARSQGVDLYIHGRDGLIREHVRFDKAAGGTEG